MQGAGYGYTDPMRPQMQGQAAPGFGQMPMQSPPIMAQQFDPTKMGGDMQGGFGQWGAQQQPGQMFGQGFGGRGFGGQGGQMGMRHPYMDQAQGFGGWR